MWITVAVVSLLSIAPAKAVWPVPSSISTGNSTLWIESSVKFTLNGKALQAQERSVTDESGTDGQVTAEELVAGAVHRAVDAIHDRNFVPWKLYRRDVKKTEPSASEQKDLITDLAITVRRDSDGYRTDGGSTWRGLVHGADESYKLTVAKDGKAELDANSTVGVMRGLETFVQLFYKHSEGGVYSQLAPVKIADAPIFSHRGVLLDVARSYFSVSSIFRTLDAMAWNKLNVLHLHVTDSQSWPLVVPSMPELSDKGAYSKHALYSPENITAIQKYALRRGVEVILEIDMPGHTGIIAESHPELIVGWQAAPWGTYCAEPPCGQFKLKEAAVDSFLDKLMDDVLPRLTAYGGHFHTGGDEVNLQPYLLEEAIRSNETAVVYPLIQAFMDRNLQRVRDRKLTPLVWEEVATKYGARLGDDVVVQSWLGAGSVKNLTRDGHKVVDSNYNYWYLDCGLGAWLNYAPGPGFEAASAGGFDSWCGPYKNWRRVYAHDPTAGLDARQAGLVLGGEVAVWTEAVDEAGLDAVLWPRASAAAEVLWSGARDPVDGRNRSQVEAAPRLAALRERMIARGVAAAAVQMPWCTQGMNGSACQFGN